MRLIMFAVLLLFIIACTPEIEDPFIVLEDVEDKEITIKFIPNGYEVERYYFEHYIFVGDEHLSSSRDIFINVSRSDPIKLKVGNISLNTTYIITGKIYDMVITYCLKRL